MIIEIIAMIEGAACLGGCVYVYYKTKALVKIAANHANNSANAADAANNHAYHAEDQANKAEEHSKTTQHFVGVRLIAASQPSGQGHNIGRR